MPDIRQEDALHQTAFATWSAWRRLETATLGGINHDLFFEKRHQNIFIQTVFKSVIYDILYYVLTYIVKIYFYLMYNHVKPDEIAMYWALNK